MGEKSLRLGSTTQQQAETVRGAARRTGSEAVMDRPETLDKK